MTQQRTENDNNLRMVLHKYWLILVEWKWTAALFLIVAVVGTTLFAFLRTPIYTSRAKIWIESDPNILPFEQVVQFEPWSSALQSYFELFQSRALIKETIQELKLFEDPHFLRGLEKQTSRSDMSDPLFMERLVDEFLKKISIDQITNSSLVEIRLMDSDPHFAARILNSFIDSYVEMIIRMRFLPTEQAAGFLGTQIARVRDEIDQSQNKLQEYGAAKNIVTLSSSETSYVENLSSVNKALTDAQIERAEKQAYYNGIKDAVLGDIPEAMTNPLIQSLRAEYSRLNREYARKLENLQPEYPEMQRQKAELDKARDDLREETDRLKRTAQSEYQAALQKEQSLQRMFDKLKAEAYNLNSNYVIYNSLRNEILNKTTLLEALIRRQSEMDVSADLKDFGSSNIWIVDRASVPLDPTFPKKRQIVLYGLLFGLAGGIGLAIGLDYLNSSVRTSKDVSRTTGLPTLGVVPSLNSGNPSSGARKEYENILGILKNPSPRRRDSLPPGKTGFSRRLRKLSPPKKERARSEPPPETNGYELFAHTHPDSVQAENFRSIRTTMFISSPPGKIKTILFTSPLAQEGKSSTVSNLALVLAQANKRVVIVDSDLRKPRQGDIFGVKKEDGLTNFLSSHVDWLDLVKPTGYQNLYVVNSGPTPANPIELLGSEKMDDLVAFLRKSFDYVLFDAPPILVVSDAIALGPMIDATILIAWGGRTPLQALAQAKQKLDHHRLKCLGVILNDVSAFSPDGYYAQQYYKSYKT